MTFSEQMKFRGGLRYGNSFPDSINTTWPLARIQIDQDTIETILPWRRLRFPRAYIKRLVRYSGYIAIGVQIEHMVLEQPNLIVFWTYHFPDVKSCLEQHGFSFSGKK